VYDESSDSWVSPAGLKYSRFSEANRNSELDRVGHVQSHTHPMPGKRSHTEFGSSDMSIVLSWVDEAYVARGAGRDEGNRTVFEVPAGQQVGKNGERTIRIVVQREAHDQLISAYPIP